VSEEAPVIPVEHILAGVVSELGGTVRISGTTIKNGYGEKALSFWYDPEPDQLVVELVEEENILYVETDTD